MNHMDYKSIGCNPANSILVPELDQFALRPGTVGTVRCGVDDFGYAIAIGVGPAQHLVRDPIIDYLPIRQPGVDEGPRVHHPKQMTQLMIEVHQQHTVHIGCRSDH